MYFILLGKSHFKVGFQCASFAFLLLYPLLPLFNKYLKSGQIGLLNDPNIADLFYVESDSNVLQHRSFSIEFSVMAHSSQKVFCTIEEINHYYFSEYVYKCGLH